MRPSSYGLPTDVQYTNDANPLGSLGMSQEFNLPDNGMQTQEDLFHQSLLRSMEELLANEASIMPTSEPQAPQSGVFSYHEGSQSFSNQQHASVSNEAFQMFAASQLQMLSQQQQQQQLPPQLPQQRHGFTSEPHGYANEGSAMFVTAENMAQLGLPGWAGHRVVALPGEMVKPMTVLYNLDTNQTSAIPAHQLGSANSIYLPQSMDGSSLGSMQQRGVASWAHLQGGSEHQHVTHGAMERPMGLSGLQSAPHLVAPRGGRGMSYGPKARNGGRHYPNAGYVRPIANTSVRTAAPTWAGADWDPLRNVQSNNGLPRAQGTGVFLPHLEAGDDEAHAPEQQQQNQQSQQQSRQQNQDQQYQQRFHAQGKLAAPTLSPGDSKDSTADSFDGLQASLLPSLDRLLA